jgi:transglutaminase-like putative cysteine protease
MNRPKRMSGARLWLTSAVLLASVAVGMRSLGALIAPGAWMSRALWVTVPVAVVVVVLRQVVRSRLAPTAWGLLAAVTSLAAWYGDVRPGPSVPSPTAETVERLRLLVDSGVQAITDGRIPVQPTRGLGLLVVAGTVATYVLAELLVVGLGHGALGSLLLLGLWAPTIAFERDPGFGLVVAGGTFFLLLLVLTRPRARRNDRTATQEAPLATAAAAGLTVAALLLGTAAGSLPFYGSADLPSGWGDQGLDNALRVSTDLDMRADLDARSDRPLLRYTGDGTAIDALRMYTLATFDGQEWQRTDAGEDVRDASGLIWPDPNVVVADREPSQVEVEVFALNQDRLPIPTEPTLVDVDGRWFYDAGRDEVAADGRTTRGLSYGLTITPRALTAGDLRTDTAGEPADVDAFLQVPATQHEADIRALAEEVTAAATTTYDQAIALQSYLRNAQLFEYSTELGPARTDDAVWDFLTDRRGYCVQYATAMTLMARMLGIPARMAVGFLPGQADGDSNRQWVVSGRQAHTWPELYFDDAGWVRFEPTPARQTGAPPLYADPFAGQSQVPDDQIPTSTAGPIGPPTTGPTAPDGTRPGYVTLGSTDLPIVGVVGVAALVAVGVATFLVLAVRRRRVQARVPHDPEEWWARLRERLAAHGVVWTDATTPRQAVRLVRDRLPSPADADPTELTDAHSALDGLLDALEAERYTTRPVAVTGEEMGVWVDAVERPLGTPVVARD